MSSSDVSDSEQSKRTFRNRLSLKLLNLSTSSSKKLNGQTSTISSLGPASPTESTYPHGPMSIPPSTSPSSSFFPLSPNRSPLFSTSSVHMSASDPVSNDALPPTVNELDAEEKAKLLRKTRKLSRVFGEVPSLPQASLFHPRGGHISSTSSFHRRSLSSVSTADSQSHSSSRHRRVARKVPSQPDVRSFVSFESHGNIQHPQLPKSLLNASFDSDYTPTDLPLTSTTSFTSVQMSPEGRRRIRMAKLRRRLGVFDTPPEVVTFTPPPHAKKQEDLRYRKSIDVPVHTSSRNFSAKSLRRTRSNACGTTRSQFDSVLGTPREDAISFHRRYVQDFGLESRITHPEEQEVHNEKFQVPAKSAESESTQDTGPQDVEIQSISNVSVTDSIGLDSIVKDGSGIVVKERDIDQDSVIGPDPAQLRSTFQERRRRAAKLAQFFGVGYHDISASLPISELRAPPTRPHHPVQVDIRTKSRRFWGGGGDEYWTCNDADMVEVIDKLRDLRA
uniref:Uncharacterized protein n=1 Tax=Moniliophthora roreri TaxID=221103 RepID=A0A0W0G2R6_MONRR